MAQKAEDLDATFILKCTRECNLHCAYCSDRRGSSDKMDVAFLRAFYESISCDKELNRVTFIWHGGEPLTLGVEFIRKLFFLQRNILTDKPTLRNIIQTNGTLVDDEIAAHFKAYSFNVGVSMDGPAVIHDKTRRTVDGDLSFEHCLRGLEILRRHEVRFGVLTVISPALLKLGPESLMEFFREIEVSNYAFLFLRQRRENKNKVSNYATNFAEFIGKAAELWFAEDDPNIHVRELESKLDRFFGLRPRLCTELGTCVGRYFGVEADGGIWHCDKFLNDDRFYLGSVGGQDFSRIRNSSKLAELVQHERNIRSLCADCKWYQLCGGGCLYDCSAFHARGGRPGTIDCPQYTIYEHMSQLIAQSPVIIEAALTGNPDDPFLY